MDSKDSFGPVSLCKSSDVAIVQNISLALQCITQIRLALWILFVILLFRRKIALTGWVMLLICVEFWK